MLFAAYTACAALGWVAAAYVVQNNDLIISRLCTDVAYLEETHSVALLSVCSSRLEIDFVSYLAAILYE
jgi:hypothetical protein